MREFTVGANDAGQRLDKFIAKTAKNMPSSLMYKFIRTKKIKVNRKRAEISQRLEEGDVVLMFVPEDMFTAGVSPSELASAPDTVSVVYEDANVLLCDKPVGVLSHSGELNASPADERGTLIYAVWAYLCKSGAYDPAAENSFRPALANRIDRNTSGIVIAAKTAAALRELNDLIRERKIEKYYLCAAHGKFTDKSGTLTAYHVKDERTNTVRIYKNPSPEAKKIVTAYRVVDYNAVDDLSLVEVHLVTGRTHQIRAHFEFIGHPLLGENKYGSDIADFKAGYKTQALCSYRLKFSECGGTLAYLKGKSFMLPPERIGFTDLFDKKTVAAYLKNGGIN